MVFSETFITGLLNTIINNMPPRTHYLLISFMVLIQSTPLWAEQAGDQSNKTQAKPLQLAPTGHIYSPYLADQKRVTFGLQLLYVSQTDIPATSSQRFALRMGGRLELFNWQNPSDPQQQLQANFEVGFRGHFDTRYSQDNTGWDGNYGLLFSYKGNDTVAWRFGVYHNSSHVGDEYVERTGRRRIGYTREEILAGMQVNLTPRWQYYLEAGYGYNADEKPLQDYKRAQTGIQYQQTRLSSSKRLGWYAGLDLTSYEERNWDINKALQIGFAFDADPHVWRVAFDYYRGQSVLGEFFQHDEEYAGIGLYLDI